MKNKKTSSTENRNTVISEFIVATEKKIQQAIKDNNFEGLSKDIKDLQIDLLKKIGLEDITYLRDFYHSGEFSFDSNGGEKFATQFDEHAIPLHDIQHAFRNALSTLDLNWHLDPIITNQKDFSAFDDKGKSLSNIFKNWLFKGDNLPNKPEEIVETIDTKIYKITDMLTNSSLSDIENDDIRKFYIEMMENTDEYKIFNEKINQIYQEYKGDKKLNHSLTKLFTNIRNLDTQNTDDKKLINDIYTLLLSEEGQKFQTLINAVNINQMFVHAFYEALPEKQQKVFLENTAAISKSLYVIASGKNDDMASISIGAQTILGMRDIIKIGEKIEEEFIPSLKEHVNDSHLHSKHNSTLVKFGTLMALQGVLAASIGAAALTYASLLGPSILYLGPLTVPLGVYFGAVALLNVTTITGLVSCRGELFKNTKHISDKNENIHKNVESLEKFLNKLLDHTKQADHSIIIG